MLTGARLSGWALIAGTLLYMAGQAVKPGVFTSPSWSKIADNIGATHVGVQLAVLGLLLVVFGLLAFWRSSEHDRAGDALARFGIMVIVIAEAGLLFSEGFNHFIGHLAAGHEGAVEDLESVALPLQYARVSLSVIGGSAVVLGAAFLAWGLWTRFSGGFYKPFALVVALLLTPGFVVNVLSMHLHSDPLIYLTFLLTLPLALWFLLLGVGLAKGGRTFAEGGTGA